MTQKWNTKSIKKKKNSCDIVYTVIKITECELHRTMWKNPKKNHVTGGTASYKGIFIA